MDNHDLISIIMTYMSFADRRKLLSIQPELYQSKKLWRFFWKLYIHNMVQKMGNDNIQFKQINIDNYLFSDIECRCDKFTYYPQTLCNTYKPADVVYINEHTVRYTGANIGNNRCVFSNIAFPINHFRELPFTTLQPKLLPKLPRMEYELKYRRIGYFEMTLKRHPEYVHNGNECVAIGLSTYCFPIKTKMPGWDRNSYGYHSDDGNIYHGAGQGNSYGPEFGIGNTVGCGLIYRKHNMYDIFFTNNGKYLGIAFKDITATNNLFPTIGIDSTMEIEINFGQDEFAFNIDKHEHHIKITEEHQNQQDQQDQHIVRPWNVKDIVKTRKHVPPIMNLLQLPQHLNDDAIIFLEQFFPQIANLNENDLDLEINIDIVPHNNVANDEVIDNEIIDDEVIDDIVDGNDEETDDEETDDYNDDNDDNEYETDSDSDSEYGTRH